jgi:hypothetical protein
MRREYHQVDGVGYRVVSDEELPVASRRQRRRRRRRFDHDALIASLPSPESAGGQPTILRLTACDGSTTHESTVLSLQELPIAREKWPVVWLDVDGFGDLATIRAGLVPPLDVCVRLARWLSGTPYEMPAEIRGRTLPEST